MRIARRLLLALAALAVSVAHVSALQVAAPTEVAIGERRALSSEVLGEERAYWVYLPASYYDSTYAPQAYPVMYLLDGDAHFHSATGVVQFMSTGINGNMQIPEMIVVAIPNTNRTRDLTPTQTTRGFDGAEAPGLAASGGGDDFLRFMREELFAEIDSAFRTRPYRLLVGHSFGGLVALHALMAAPDMFDSHIAIDPSLWWDDQLLVRQAEEHFVEGSGLTGSVYVTLANNPSPLAGQPSLMRTAGEDFFELMERAASSSFRTDLRYFEAEDHGSVPLISLYHGLLHTFPGYKPSLAGVIEDPETLAAHFASVSERLGVEFLPPEPTVNRLGYALLAQDTDKAIVLFELNTTNYPDSYNAFDSLGEGYEAADKPDQAIASFEKSLVLNPNNKNAKDRLTALRGGSPQE